MQTFLEFIERKNFEVIFEGYVSQIAEEAENNPKFNQILIQEGFWDTIGNVGKGIGKFAQGVWSGGGIKPGFQAGVSQVVGPESQFKSAIGALQRSLTQLQRDPNWINSKTTGSNTLPSMGLIQWLSDTIKELQTQVGQFQNKQITTGQSATTSTAQPQPGAATGGGPKQFGTSQPQPGATP